jgi:hypothetical protein
LAKASTAVSAAVGDCGGTNQKCALDITGVVTDLAGASSEISKAVADCNSTAHLKCVLDCGLAADEIAKAGVGIAAAVKDCAANTTATATAAVLQH